MGSVNLEGQSKRQVEETVQSICKDLWEGAISGDETRVQDALSRGVDVNAKDTTRSNRTALHQVKPAHELARVETDACNRRPT